MRFNKYLFFLIIILAACNASEVNSSEASSGSESRPQLVDLEELRLNSDEGLYYFNDRPFTGKGLSYHYNDSLALSIDFEKGKKHGHFRKWFPTGKQSFEADYQEGRLHGQSFTWWINGNLRSESQFENGVAHGTQLQYYKSGQLFKRINLNHGVEAGLQQSWRENGKLYNNYEARDGRIFGLKRSKLCFQLDDQIIAAS